MKRRRDRSLWSSAIAAVLTLLLLSACTTHPISSATTADPGYIDPCEQRPISARAPDPTGKPKVTIDDKAIDESLECSPELMLLFASNDPIGPLLRDVDAAITDYWPDDPEILSLVDEGQPMPEGVSAYVDLYDVDEDLAKLRRIAARLERQHHHAVITVGNNEYSPLEDLPRDTKAIVGALSVVGSPECCKGDPSASRFWRPKAASLARVADRAISWCRDAGSPMWLASYLSSAKVDEAEANELVRLAMTRSYVATTVSCASDETHGRLIDVDDAGHVLLIDAGSTSRLDAVGDLRDVFIDTMEHLDQATVSLTSASTSSSGISQHDRLWGVTTVEEATNVEQPRIDERHHLLDAHGLQLLGPGFDVPDLPPHWRVSEPGVGWTLVEHTDLERWFLGNGDRALQRQAHHELGSLMSPTWTPRDDAA